ncbi:hypothetical protein JL722_9037 [Aureococcus anophagefferens]|nr:hypothetical protein JL722_9037 [Aureococcus anophagefferens]
MADDEPMEEAPAAEVEVQEMSVLDALKDVLKRALIHGGLKRGLREVAKALDSRTAKLCCLAKDCDNAEYSRLVRALCDEGGVNLIMVDEGRQLGEWAGLCKIGADGEATKVVRCSAACVTEFGEDTHALSVLLNYLKSQAPRSPKRERDPRRPAAARRGRPALHRARDAGRGGGPEERTRRSAINDQRCKIARSFPSAD